MRKAKGQRQHNSQSLPEKRSDVKKQQQEKKVQKQWACIGVGVTGLMMLLTWIIPNFAEAFSEWCKYIVAAATATAGIVFGKKQKFYAALVIGLAFIFSFNVTLAKAMHDYIDERKQEESVEEDEGGKDGEGDEEDNEEIPEGEEKQELVELIWEEDIFILNLNIYSKSNADDKERLCFLMKQYSQKYVNGESFVVIKSDDELNGGKYGEHLDLANAYARDYANVEMVELKILALNNEISEREIANTICEKFNNLKILGDCYVKKVALNNLVGAEKQEELKKAIKCYIKALPLAYYDGSADGEDVVEIWKALAVAYSKVSKVTDDSAHQVRSDELSDLCVRISTELMKETYDELLHKNNEESIETK